MSRKIMNGSELKEFQYGFKDIYDLPYKSNSGVRFSDNGVCMVTQYGIVFADNGYLGGEKYYPMLQHIERAGDGSTKYQVSVNVSAEGNADLDTLGAAIVSNIKENAKAALRGLGNG